MEIINLTKKTLVLLDAADRVVEIRPDARHVGIVATTERAYAAFDSDRRIPLSVQQVSGVNAMPAPVEETIYVVPSEVAMALQSVREDVYFPAEVQRVRDADGVLRDVTPLRRITSNIKG